MLAMRSEELVSCLSGALAYFENNYKMVDNLNVFPVPDGDTGVNMLFTLKPAVEAVSNVKTGSIVEIARLLDEEMTHNSRGNSGFILSRFFSGFSAVLKDHESVSAELLAEAFSGGLFLAKTSLSAPVEGTMLSVMEAMAQSMKSSDAKAVPELLDIAIDEGRKELFLSPEKLPMLKKAGVVDSGALGFVFVVEGMRRGLTGDKVLTEDESDYRFEPDPNVSADDLMKVSFRYCTEIEVENKKNLPIDEFEDFLKGMGDSLALMAGDGFVKLHIHTDDPEAVVSRAESFGEISRKKIEDMQQQVQMTFSYLQEDSEMGLLAVVPGEGFREVFLEIEPEAEILVYGKNLPSAGEITRHLQSMPNENIIVLPNDKNIVPAVKIAQEKSGKNIQIIESKNVVEGLGALFGFVKNLSPQENIESMNENRRNALCIALYQSIKDSRFGEVLIKNEDYFSVMDGEIASVSSDLLAATLSAFEKLDLETSSSVSVFYNDETNQSLFDSIEKEIQMKNEFIQFEARFGGQNTAVLLIAVE